MFKRILVAVDGSPAARRGLKAAIDFARNEQATLEILHVVEDSAAIPFIGDGYVPPEYVELLLSEVKARGVKILERARQGADEAGVATETLMVETQGAP